MKIRGILLMLTIWMCLGTQAQTILPSHAPKISAEELAEKINNKEAEHWVIFNTGPVNDIAGAINIGAVEEKKNVKKLKKYLKKIPRNTPIIYYCGCCPFATCPNLLPAYQLLEKMGFTNHKALDLPKSLKLDWMEKSYPMKSAN